MELTKELVDEVKIVGIAPHVDARLETGTR